MRLTQRSDCGYRFAGCIATVLGVHLGRVRWELVDFQPVSILAKPSPHVSILVVGSIVLNQNGPLPPVAARQLLQKSQSRQARLRHRVAKDDEPVQGISRHK